MGMGYAACFDVVVNNEYVRSFPEYDELMEILEEKDLSLVAFAIEAQYGEYDSFSLEVLEGWRNLQLEFKTATELDLYIRFHDPDDGDRYDDIGGVFFIVNFNSAYQLTPAAEAIKDMLELMLYVDFG